MLEQLEQSEKSWGSSSSSLLRKRTPFPKVLLLSGTLASLAGVWLVLVMGAPQE